MLCDMICDAAVYYVIEKCIKHNESQKKKKKLFSNIYDIPKVKV